MTKEMVIGDFTENRKVSQRNQAPNFSVTVAPRDNANIQKEIKKTHPWQQNI
jgi:hypothetical protein